MDINIENLLDDAVAKGGEGSEFLKLIRELMVLPRYLNEDLAEARQLFRFATHEFAARTMVRTMAAEFEAKLYLLQQLLLQLHRKDSINLKPEEIVLLQGQTYAIGHGGKVISSPKFLKFQDSLLFTAHVWSRCYKHTVFANTSDPRWQHVLTYLKVRNRLMHPKQRADLDISEAEIESLNRAQDWLREYFQSFFNPIKQADDGA